MQKKRKLNTRIRSIQPYKEIKYTDKDINWFVLNDGWTAGWVQPIPIGPLQFALSSTVKGDGPTNRNGRECVMTSIHCKGTLWYQPTTNDKGLGNSCRIIVAHDKQTNGGVGGQDAQRVIKVTRNDGVPLGQRAIFGMRNLDYTHRYTILYDQIFTFNEVGYDTVLDIYSGVTKNFEFHKKINIRTTYQDTAQGNAGEIGGMTGNSVSMYATMNYDSDGGVKGRVLIQAVTRMRFVDC